jgi:hypothetical protein
MIRRSLADGGLETAAEFDITGRIRKSLKIDLPPCGSSALITQSIARQSRASGGEYTAIRQHPQEVCV